MIINILILALNFFLNLVNIWKMLMQHQNSCTLCGLWTFVNSGIIFNNISDIWWLSVLLTEETGNQRINNTDLLQFTNKLSLFVLSWTIITSHAIENELSHIETYRWWWHRNGNLNPSYHIQCTCRLKCHNCL